MIKYVYSGLHGILEDHLVPIDINGPLEPRYRNEKVKYFDIPVDDDEVISI